MLQPLALPGSTRDRAKADGDLLADLRRAVTAETGAADLELEDLERVKPRTVLMVCASALAFYALLPQLANLEDTIDAFGDAELGWIAGALAASAITYLASSVALQGAVAEPLPLGPNLRAQVASSFAALVGPAGLGGYALAARFLERVGVGRAEAGTSVAIKGIAGLATHVVLLFAFVAWTGSTGVGSFSVSGSQTVLVVVLVVLVVAGGLLAIRPVRRAVLRPLVDAARSGAAQIGRVFRSPERVAALFGGSAAMTLAYVASVACCVQAFGGDLTFSQVGAAYLVAVAIASIAPTPGNLGAIEAAMIAGLTGFGLADGIAVSATLTFRLATFWLPLLPGWVATEVMQRRDEL
jgi:undecaprenyl-diphosphatase